MYKLLGVWTFLLLLVSGCAVSTKRSAGKQLLFMHPERLDKAWELVWEDNFDGQGLDTSKWSRITVGPSDWNRHMSTDDRCFNMSDGKLQLLGINNPDTSVDKRPFITGGIRSKGKFAFQYGKVEIRAKLESAQGAWPAIWMLSELERYGKYPRSGEIDIMEHLNYDTIIYQTIHSHYTRNLGKTSNPAHHGTAAIVAGEYNVYGLSWYPDRLEFYVNGKNTFTYPKVSGEDPLQWPYDQPFYLLIDQQLGGSWVGEVDRKQLPVVMEVDWVKVYQ